jgi:hypothetical protein
MEMAPDNLPYKVWSGTRVVLFTLLAAAAIVLLCTLRYRQFFFIDDAQNQNIGFYREMGRLWLSGHLPILTTRTLFGGNILVDMVVSPFAPQVIIGSLLASSTKSVLLVANTMAFIDVAMVILGGYWVGRILMIRPCLSLLLGVLAGSTPCFLYIYTASWWNMAHAYAWMIMAIAALMQLRQRPSAQNFLAAVTCGCFLFTSAGTQLQVFYALMFFPVLFVEWSTHRRVREVLILVCAGVCVLCISTIPITAEYVLNRHLVTRFSSFQNTGNFINAEWGHLLNFFDPFYGIYMSWFTGWRYVPLSLGYAGVALLPPLLFKQKFVCATGTRAEWWIIATGLFLSVIASMSPSQIGPMRFSIRFLPIFTFWVAATSLYGIQHWPWVKSSRRVETGVKWLTLIAATFSILQIFSASTSVLTRSSIVFAYLLWVFLRSFSWYVLQRGRGQGVDVGRLEGWAWACTVLALVGMLIQTGSLGRSQEGPLLFDDGGLASTLETVNNVLPGLTLSLAGHSPRLRTWDLDSGQLLAIGQASVNGYSAVGHTGFEKFFRSRGTQGWFEPKSSLLNMAHVAKNGVPIYRYFGIRRIYAWDRDLTQEVITHMVHAGLTKLTSLPDHRVQIEPATLTPIEGSLTYQSAPGGVKHIRSDGPRREWFSVEPSTISRELVFNRIYWDGYEAEINGQMLPIHSWKNTLVSLTLPPEVEGELYIHYMPKSWKFTRFSLSGGIILTLLMVIYLMKCMCHDQKAHSRRS